MVVYGLLTAVLDPVARRAVLQLVGNAR
jgi:hypothetical protein